MFGAVDESNRNGAEQNLGNNVSLPTTKASEVPPETPPKVTKIEVQSHERRNRRQKRFESVKELRKLGLSKSEITRRLNLNWRTVDKYIRVAECPFYTGTGGHKDSSILDPYNMIKRWNEGCHNATRIWREIQDMGFGGSRRIVGEWATKIRSSIFADRVTKKNASLSTSSAAWLLSSQSATRQTEEDKQLLELMKQADKEVSEAYVLSQRFTEIVRERQHGSLIHQWLEDVIKSETH